MNKPVLTACPVFQKLTHHAQEAQSFVLSELFTQETDRFPKMSVSAAGLLLDYSKNHMTDKTLALLLELAQECQLESKRDAMFSGEIWNQTEHRAVLHTALRAPRGAVIMCEGKNVVPEVYAVLDQVRNFSENIRSGNWKGRSNQPITDIVNIGIGGSDLGPRMVCQALSHMQSPELRVHFVSNVDGHDLNATLKGLNPDTTLFIIASKTFTTLETMLNAHSARDWFLKQGQTKDLPQHFVAISTNAEAVKAFGIDTANMFPFWDWVGGRYSVWSAVGLSIALAVGYDHFTEFLAGAHAMDVHFSHAPLSSNMPVLLALIGIWNRNFLNRSSLSIAPYLEDLKYFPSYLQQLEMESNGKQVQMDSTRVNFETCPVVWGNVGTNGQHAYFQLLHQGTDITPIDFITALKPAHPLKNHHAALLANCFAQSEALMRGKTATEVRADLEALKMPPAEIEKQIPHRTFPGNRPSNTLLLPRVSPEALGALVALYEHKTFVQGAIWNLNSFDQWGVELGKVLAKTIQAELEGGSPNPHDSSTAGLISIARAALS